MALDPQRPRLIHLFVSASLGPNNFCEREGSLSELGNEGLLKVAHKWTRILSRLSYRFSEQTCHVRKLPSSTCTPLPVFISLIGDLVVTTVPCSRRSLASSALQYLGTDIVDVVVALSNASGSEVWDIVQSMGKSVLTV